MRACLALSLALSLSLSEDLRRARARARLGREVISLRDDELSLVPKDISRENARLSRDQVASSETELQRGGYATLGVKGTGGAESDLMVPRRNAEVSLFRRGVPETDTRAKLFGETLVPENE